MVTYYNKTDMVSFAKYMVSDERRERLLNHPNAANMLPIDERLQTVYEEDFDQWLKWKKEKKSENDNQIEK